jgi:hypothetical protein
VNTSSQPTATERVSETTDYVRTGCIGIILTWGVGEDADRVRDTLIRAAGRDCVCEEGLPCFLADGALRYMDLQLEQITAGAR